MSIMPSLTQHIDRYETIRREFSGLACRFSIGSKHMDFQPLIPELSVSDFEKSLSFYSEILPFRVEFQRPESQFAFLSYQGCQLMITHEQTTWKTGALEYPYGRGIHLAMLVDRDRKSTRLNSSHVKIS